LYQQTEVQPNPMSAANADVAEDEFNLKFVLGSDLCTDLAQDKKYCNGRLQPNTRYGIIARTFTSNGYRDTSPVFIGLQGNVVAIASPRVLLMGSALILTLISISIIVICCCCNSKRQKKLREKKKAQEAAEADENLLSFTSYCVIDRTPLPRKHFDDVL